MTTELRLRNFAIQTLDNADRAFGELSTARWAAVESVLVDVMLAVGNVESGRFSRERTDDYLETGLRLVEDLAVANPAVFPSKAVLLTNTANWATFGAAVTCSKSLQIPLWQKSEFASPLAFAQAVTQRIAEVGGVPPSAAA